MVDINFYRIIFILIEHKNRIFENILIYISS